MKIFESWRSATVPATTLLVLLGGFTALTRGASRAPVRAAHGMVVSSSPLASDAGLEILKRGGNAVDAAVAVGFALAVVHPRAGNLGGGGFMLVHQADGSREFSVDFREMAPAAASRDMYLNAAGQVVRGRSTVGYLASGVPGSVAGLHLAWKKAGHLKWRKLLAPAIRLARDGFRVSYALSRSLEASRKKLSQFEETSRIFLRQGNLYREGEILKQPELARTLEEIARRGPRVFYQGEIARKIAAQMKAHGGDITLEDLRRYRALIRPPVRGTYRGYEVISMGPPSSGGVILVEMLNMIEPFPVANLGRGSSDLIHLEVEVMRRAFADRAEFLGDPDFTRLPLKGLTAKAYARKEGADIRRDWASPSNQISHGDPAPFESEETTHYSIVDASGNGVATTTTLNGSYGSGVTIRGAGFLMNNEMDDFSSKPGEPNMYGLIQGEANSIAPGKRPLSAMTPTLVKREGKLFMVLGSPGGPTIINTVFQILLNVIDHGMDVQAAVSAPRIHHQWLPDRIVAERGALVRDVEEALRSRGHQIEYRERIGEAQAILIDPVTEVRLGGSDPRAESKASGY